MFICIVSSSRTTVWAGPLDGKGLGPCSPAAQNSMEGSATAVTSEWHLCKALSIYS